MGMTVKKRKDSSLKRVFVHKIADIRGGVSVNSAELTQDYLAEGTPISKPISGIAHVVKFAILKANAAADATVYTVEKGHNFKVGDIIMLAKGAKAYAITAIATNETTASYDDITVGTSLGATAVAGAAIYHASAQSASNTSAFKYEPFALIGTGRVVEASQNLDSDAWVIGVTCGNQLPSLIAAELKGIINY